MSVLTWRDAAGLALLVASLLFLLGGAIGALVLRDPLARLHAARLSTGFGAPLFVAGLCAIAPTPLFAPLAGFALACAVGGPTLVQLMAALVFERARAG